MFNNNDITHLNRGQDIKDKARLLYKLCKVQDEEWNELYKSGSSRALDASPAHDSDWGATSDIGIDFSDFSTAMGQFVAMYIDFYEGGAAIADRERGADLRKLQDTTLKLL